MNKKITILLTFLLIFSTSVVFADNFAKGRKSEIITYEESEIEHDALIENFINTNGPNSEIPLFLPRYAIPPEGTTRFVTSNYIPGTMVKHGNGISGIYNTIKNESITYLLSKVEPVSAAIIGLAALLDEDIDPVKFAENEAYTSYEYVYKDIEVSNGTVWQKWYRSEKRYLYKHNSVVFTSKTGYARGEWFNRTPDDGYGPYATQYANYYNNDTELENRGISNYLRQEWYYAPDEI